MIRIPSLLPDLRLEVLDDDLAFLVSDREAIALEGPLLSSLVRHVDGTADVSELTRRLGDGFNPLDVYYGLSLLEELGCIEGAPKKPADPLPAPSFPWGVASSEHGTLSAGLGLRTVGLSLSPAEHARVSHGPRESGGSAGLTLVLTDDYQAEALGALNREHLGAGEPWILAKPVGPEVWIGPLMAPGDTACWRCLSDLMSRNLRVHSFIRRYRERRGVEPDGQGHRPILPSALEAARSAAEAALSVGSEHPLRGRLWSWNPSTGRTSLHPVPRRSQCPDCGAAGSRIPVLPSFDSPFVASGTPTDRGTWTALAHNLDPLVGPVSELTPVSSEVQAPRVWMAPNPAARDRTSWKDTRESLRSRCVGKGMSDDQARLGTLCEALERYSGVAQGAERRVRGSARELAPEAIHPNDCLNFSPAQYAERDRWNRSQALWNWIPEPFDPEATMDWTPVWSLTHRRRRLLPLDYVYYRVDDGERSPFFRPDSNGCAAGSSLGDAMLRGFFEVVERDCVAIWWYNSLVRPNVDLESFENRDLDGMVDQYRRLGTTVRVHDITNDFEIPAFAAVASLSGGAPRDVVLGFGAHADVRTAVRGALLELGQCLASIPGGGPYGTELGFDPTRLDPTFLLDVTGRETRAAEDYPLDNSEDGPAQLGHGLRRVHQMGLELLVLDQTRREVGLPTARVVVPGMRQHWARFREGRLFDVPVQMGWLEQPRRESDLNPAHLYL